MPQQVGGERHDTGRQPGGRDLAAGGALRDLGQDLHAGVGTVQWVSAGYLLALAMAVPLSGWTVERFGARRMWLLSLLLFLGGSLLCGAAWNIGALIAFRAVQGVGGGLMIPIMQTLLMRAAGGRQIGRLIAVVSLPALVAPIFGPVIGGLILSHWSWSWRWIFCVNLPICLAAVALALRHLPADGPGRAGLRLDVRALLLLSPALAAVIYGLSSAVAGGFGRPPVLAPVACGAAVLAVILQREPAGSGGQAAAAYGHTFTWELGFTAPAVLPALLLPSAAGPADAASPSSAERTKERRDR